MALICRFVSIATWECVMDDGLRDNTPADLMYISTVWLTSNVDTAQKMAEFELESEGQWMDDSKPLHMGWEEQPLPPSAAFKRWHYVDLDHHKKDNLEVYAILDCEEAPVHDTPPIEPASSFGG